MFGFNFYRKKRLSLLEGSEIKEFKSFDGTNIYYDVNLTDNPKGYIVLLHGMGGNLSAWDPERKHLKKLGYSTLAMDLRGHGLSGRPKKSNAYDIVNFAKDVIGVIKTEKIENCTLLGHCFGGMVAILVAGENIPNIKSLILVETSYKPPYLGQYLGDSKFLSRMLTLLTRHAPDIGVPSHTDYSFFKNTADYDLRRLLADVMNTSLQSYLRIFKEVTGYDSSKALEKINVPTLVIEGSEDTVFEPDLVNSLARRIKKSKLDVLEGNHILVLNTPKDLVEEIDGFLTQLKSKHPS